MTRFKRVSLWQVHLHDVKKGSFGFLTTYSHFLRLVGILQQNGDVPFISELLSLGPGEKGDVLAAPANV